MILIGMAGAAGAGKDTAADYLVETHGFLKLSMAGPLKAGLAAMGLPEPADRDEKERVIPGLGFSWRKAAQTLGTEWGRGLHSNLWVLLMERALLALPLTARVVISDVRFPNEVYMVDSRGGFVIRLRGRQTDLGAAAMHASETSEIHADLAIDNSGPLRHLHDELDRVVAHLSKSQEGK